MTFNLPATVEGKIQKKTSPTSKEKMLTIIEKDLSNAFNTQNK
jgi:hypothetical protein